MKKIKFAVCILLIISTILTFSLPLVADESGEGTKDTVKKDDSFYLSEETLEKIGPFKKIKVDKDTKYLTIYRGFVHDLTVVSIDEFISMFDGVESIYGSYDDLPDLMNNDESKGYYEGDEWKINRQKFIIAYSSNGRFETKTFDLNFTDGSLYESTNGSSTYENYVNELIGKNEYIPEKVISAASNDSIIKCIDSELEKILDDAFTFDNFEWQIQNDVRVKEQFRADGLERIIYRCPACHSEGSTLGKGTSFSCLSCRKKWFVDEYCRIVDEDGVTNTVTSIYDDERSAVRSEILSGRYLIDVNVKIGVMVDRKAIYFVGDGRLTHDINGFHLSGCGGELEYRQSPLASYSLYSDYYWYELGDMICIGNNDILYYCFPDKNGVVTKARLAAEELYKICKKNQSGASPSNADPE